MGGLALALEQAAAYFQATNSTLTEYLGLFRERRSDVLNRGEVASHPGTVAVTLGLALSRLERDTPSLPGTCGSLRAWRRADRARRAACGRDIPAGLDDDVTAVLSPLQGGQLARRDAIVALRRYSLVTPARDETVLVHRLVQAVTLDQAGAEQARAWRKAAAALIEAAIPRSPDVPETWLTCAALLPHAQAVLAYDSRGMSRLADFLSSSGSYTAALGLWQKITAARERVFGPEHPDTLTTRSSLARWTGEAGYPAAARDLLSELLPAEERVLGAEHPETLTTISSLARWTGQAGDRTTARDMYSALLPDMERVLGTYYLETLATRHNLAQQTGGAGEPTAARDMLTRLLPDVTRVLGAEHPNSLTTRASLPHWTGEAGEPCRCRLFIHAGQEACR